MGGHIHNLAAATLQKVIYGLSMKKTLSLFYQPAVLRRPVRRLRADGDGGLLSEQSWPAIISSTGKMLYGRRIIG
jgi:hypothetical protein